jgi:hypothetical protein
LAILVNSSCVFLEQKKNESIKKNLIKINLFYLIFFLGFYFLEKKSQVSSLSLIKLEIKLALVLVI